MFECDVLVSYNNRQKPIDYDKLPHPHMAFHHWPNINNVLGGGGHKQYGQIEYTGG